MRTAGDVWTPSEISEVTRSTALLPNSVTVAVTQFNVDGTATV